MKVNGRMINGQQGNQGSPELYSNVQESRRTVAVSFSSFYLWPD